MLCLTLALPAGAEEIRSYDKAAGGWQYAVMGVYPYEADGAMREVLWRVLSVANGQALMLADQVLDAHQVINETDQAVIKARTYRRIDSYTDSDLCAWMNSEMVETLFPDEAFRDALVEGEFGKLYCLTTEQFTNANFGFNRSMYGENFPDRKATGTPYYIERGGYVDQSTKTAPYWAATIRGKTGYQLQLVGYNGHLSWGAYTRVNVGVRPALTIDLSQCQITGAGTRAEPFLITVAGKAEAEAAPVAEETAAEAAGATEETEDASEAPDDDDAEQEDEPEDEEPAEDEGEAEPEQETEQDEEPEQADEPEEADEPEQPEESADQPETEKEPPKVMIGGVEVLLGTPAPDLSLEGRETAEPVLPSFLFTPTPAPAVTASPAREETGERWADSQPFGIRHGPRDQKKVAVKGILRVQLADRVDAAVINLGKFPAVPASRLDNRQGRQRGEIVRMLRIQLDGGQIIDLPEFRAGIIKHDGKVCYDLLTRALRVYRGYSRSAKLAAALGRSRLHGKDPLLRAVYALGIPEQQIDRNRDLCLAAAVRKRQYVRKNGDRLASFVFDLYMLFGCRRQMLRAAAQAQLRRVFLQVYRADGSVCIR